MVTRSSSVQLSTVDKRPSQGGILDRRTQVGRRRLELIAIYSAALGGPAALTDGQLIDIRKAAELITLAEQARAKALQEGTQDATELSAMVRLESTAARAVRALGIPKAGPARVVPLRERLRGEAT